MSQPIYLIKPTEYFPAFEATDVASSKELKATARAALEYVANFFIWIARGFQRAINFVAVRLPCCRNRLIAEAARTVPAQSQASGPAPSAPATPAPRNVAVMAPGAPKKPPSPKSGQDK